MRMILILFQPVDPPTHQPSVCLNCIFMTTSLAEFNLSSVEYCCHIIQLSTGDGDNIWYVGPEYKMLPEAEGSTYHMLPESPVNNCFVIPSLV